VALPYRGGRLSMLAVLPPAGGQRGCQIPAASALHALASALATSRTRTAIALPKVRLAITESLKQVLTSVRMGLA
jgi:Serpin (serine protease inhibitor)